MNFKKIVSLGLAACLCLSCVAATACKKDGSDSSSDSSSDKLYEVVPEQPSDEKTFEKTDVNLIENGKTEYKIVLPEGGDSSTSFAAQELSDFFRLSTGVTIPTVTETEVHYSVGDKYISLGETELLEEAEITVTSEELGESGYIIRTVGNSLYIAGPTAVTYHGTLYGVYDVLLYTIGFKVYAEDEIVYEKTNVVPLYNFNEKYRPSVDIRYMMYKAVTNDKTYAYRLRSLGNNTEIWSTFTHTLISTYLPYSEYGAAHPDWYVNGGQQLCLSNEEMIEELCLRVEYFLDKYPTTTHVMLGHEDNSSYCVCDKCAATTAKYGGAYSGVELELANKVAEKVNKWLEKAYPEREVKYVFFAYGPSLPAPATYDATTDTYAALCDDIYIHEDVGVMLAPVSMNFGASPNAPSNLGDYCALKAWSWLFNKKNVYVWSYALNAYSYLQVPNTFGYIKEYVEFYKDLGVKYVYNQGNYDSYVCTFEALRLYTESQLYWDASSDYNALVEDFMNQYYGLAAEGVKKYYNLIRAHYAYLDSHDYTTGTVFFLLDDTKLWSVGMLHTMFTYLDEALAALEPLKTSDPVRYETLYNRVQRERLSPVYMMLSYYMNQLSDEDKASYLADFEKYTKMFSIEATREASFGISSLIDQWKKS